MAQHENIKRRAKLKIEEDHRERKHFSTIFSLAFFRTGPPERLEEANLFLDNLVLSTGLIK